MRECKLLFFWQSANIKKQKGTLNFLHRSQWEYPKRCNILKAVDHRAKPMKMGLVVMLGAYKATNMLVSSGEKVKHSVNAPGPLVVLTCI